MESKILEHFLPAGLLDLFEITGIKDLGEVVSKEMYYEIHLEEKNRRPKGYDGRH